MADGDDSHSAAYWTGDGDSRESHSGRNPTARTFLDHVLLDSSPRIAGCAKPIAIPAGHPLWQQMLLASMPDAVETAGSATVGAVSVASAVPTASAHVRITAVFRSRCFTVRTNSRDTRCPNRGSSLRRPPLC